MFTGFYQSIPVVIVTVLYYLLDTWLMRRYSPKRTLIEKRDTLNTTVTFAALVLIVLQPILLPWLGVRTTAWWGAAIQMLGLVCFAFGLALVVWVRTHLRELFSERVELQPGHRVVNTGPYALVRHPLYSAFFLMVLGQFLVAPMIVTLLLLGFMVWHFSRLAGEEEALLSKELPGYAEYMAATSRFAPRLWPKA